MRLNWGREMILNQSLGELFDNFPTKKTEKFREVSKSSKSVKKIENLSKSLINH